MRTRGKNQRGFTLIEVLVAVLVISIGLLGLAGLQAASLRNNHSAYLRSQATLLAYDVLDRMRANVQEARAGSYNVAFGGTGGGGMAGLDLAQWQAELDRALPDGDGSVQVNGVNNVATIVVQWDDPLSDGTGQISSFNFQTRLADG